MNLTAVLPKVEDASRDRRRSNGVAAISLEDPWPTMAREAFHGIAGRVVEMIEPHSEADPAGLLLTFNVMAGASLGRGSFATADAAEHPPRLYMTQVGKTSVGRKGSTMAQIRRVFAYADTSFVESCIVGGSASGEGLINEVRDGDDGDDEGVRDKRRVVYEAEFGRVLKVIARDGNTYSSVAREAWDGLPLHVMTRKDPLRATGAHICILGHTTMVELQKNLTDVELGNGFANRFLFALTKRSKKLPSGGNLDPADIAPIGHELRGILDKGRNRGRVERSMEAEKLWSDIYNSVDDERDGIFGAVTARAEAQMLRLSVLYALLDGSKMIEVPHLEAARAVWTYCEESAAYVFGDALGDSLADRLLEALRAAGATGMTFGEQFDLFGRHVSSQELKKVRADLEAKGHAVTQKQTTSGRPRMVTYAAMDGES